MHIITNYDNVFQKYVCIVDAAHLFGRRETFRHVLM